MAQKICRAKIESLKADVTEDVVTQEGAQAGVLLMRCRMRLIGKSRCFMKPSGCSSLVCSPLP
eukprot:6173742-Pleurochrysis_carterae.AAC.4